VIEALGVERYAIAAQAAEQNEDERKHHSDGFLHSHATLGYSETGSGSFSVNSIG
jgi:hypothetical protein